MSTAANTPHQHNFNDGNPLAERNTRWALLLTVVMMVAEISAGWVFNSMALLADGWHMSSHALALGLALAAYAAARRYAGHPRFAFGTWKIEVLGGYTSALFLLAIAGLMLVESVERLLSPAPIQYDQAIGVAVLGLLVNLACAWLLKDDHHHHHGHHDHDHDHDHEHEHEHRDLNLRRLHSCADRRPHFGAGHYRPHRWQTLGCRLAGPGYGHGRRSTGNRLGDWLIAGNRPRVAECRNGQTPEHDCAATAATALSGIADQRFSFMACWP